jgi:hypothetical protein
VKDRGFVSTDADRPLRHALGAYPSYDTPSFVAQLREHGSPSDSGYGRKWPLIEERTATSATCGCIMEPTERLHRTRAGQAGSEVRAWGQETDVFVYFGTTM